MKPFLVGLCALLVLGSTATAAGAQSRTSSAIRGTVVQEDGTPVPNATVTLRHEDTGIQRSATTTERGAFLMTVLQPGGPYTLTVSHIGFAETQREGIQLQVGEPHIIELVLRQEAVEIEGIDVEVDRVDVFNPNQVGPATRLDEITLEAMPILSRNIMDLAVLSPMVTENEDGGLSVQGQNTRYNAILVDGIVTQDPFGLTPSGVPGGQAGSKLLPLDAVAQYEVLVAPYDVRLSGFTGGVMNAVTRTGTNAWRVRASGVHRNESLIGDLQLPTGPTQASGVDRSLFALSAGGPIIRDKAHFFVTGEFEERTQPPDGFNLTRDDPTLIRISPETTAGFQEELAALGMDAGSVGPLALDTRLANVFGRLDWSLDDTHRLAVRNVFSHSEHHESPNRAAFDPYELSSNAVFRTSVNNTLSAQLLSDLGARGNNELTLKVQHTRDETDPASELPQVEAELISSIDGRAFARRVRAGGQFFAQENDLSQTTVRLTDALSLQRDDNTYMFGLSVAYFDISHTSLPGAFGEYFFASRPDLEANAPQRYQRGVLLEGQSPEAAFSVAEFGGFIQNEIRAGDGLTVRVGLRVDWPHVLESPQENPELVDLFGLSTAQVPSGQPLFSPRFGFNWQSDRRLRTQVRGGIGWFVGQLPFVWLSNAFHRNGMRSITQACEGRVTDDPLTGNTALPFTPEVPSPHAPVECFNGPPTDVKNVVVFSDDFKYPQSLKFSAMVDQELSSDISSSLGLFFNKTINQIVLQEQNLGDFEGNPGDLSGYGGFQRGLFGRPTGEGFAPTWDHPEFGQVLLATNDTRDWSLSLTAELRGRLWDDRLSFQTSYTFSRSVDRMSLVSTDMLANFGLNGISRHPNSAEITTSNFDRPHKIVAALFGSPIPGLPDTELSLLYTAQSGVPFSYVYRGDYNGDGYPGLGATLDRLNDLIYVPEEASQLPASIVTQGLLAQALRTDECLAEFRGELLERNACRTPWQHRLDLRASHTVHAGSTRIRFEADVINFLNLLNSDWGWVQTVRSNVPLLEPVGRGGDGFGPGGTLISRWGGGVLPAQDEEGQLVPTDPWSISSPASQWQAQFGIHVTFDPRRRR